MNRTLYSFVILASGILFYLGNFSPVNATTQPDPTEQFRPYVEEIVSILTDPDLQTKEKHSLRRENMRGVISECFNFNEMSRRVLARTWPKLSKDDQIYFVSQFTQLLEYAYIGKIVAYSDQKIEFTNQRIKGQRAQVVTKIIDKGTIIAVSYIMMLKEDRWMVYDVIIEGVSLVRNYKEQFRQILRKEGYETLLKQVEKKVAELEQRS
jgi:phospholipid transport system substrate-binding protein